MKTRPGKPFGGPPVDNHAAANVAGEVGLTPAAVRKAKSRVLHPLRQEVGDLIA